MVERRRLALGSPAFLQDLGIDAAPLVDEAERLRSEGATTVFLAGHGNTPAARTIAKRLGIAEVEAEVLPERKGEVVANLRKQGRVVAMAGDGVNDAPALAVADVGIAMSTGADVAIESAGVTLLRGDLTGLVEARALSAAVMRNIRQNLFFAFIYNSAGVPIAAGGGFSPFRLLLSPGFAPPRRGASPVPAR